MLYKSTLIIREKTVLGLSPIRWHDSIDGKKHFLITPSRLRLFQGGKTENITNILQTTLANEFQHAIDSPWVGI